MEAGHNQAKESAISDTERNERHPREGARSLGEHSVRACLHGLADQIADRLEHAKEFGGKVLRIFKRTERAAQDEPVQEQVDDVLAEPEAKFVVPDETFIHRHHRLFPSALSVLENRYKADDNSTQPSVTADQIKALNTLITNLEDFKEFKRTEVRELLKQYGGVVMSGEAAQ